MALWLVCEAVHGKEFDSQFVQRIGHDGLSVIGHLSTIKAIDDDGDGEGDYYRLFQYVRYEDTATYTQMSHWFYKSKIKPLDSQESGFEAYFKLESTPYVNPPHVMAHYQSAPVSVLASSWAWNEVSANDPKSPDSFGL